jgi:hypothetical protein
LRFPIFWFVAFAVWLIPCLLSLWTLNLRAWDVAIPAWAARQQTRLESFRIYMATDDASIFANRDTRDMPFYYVPELDFLVHNQEIRRILPACGRDPLKVTPEAGSVSAFVTNGCPATITNAPAERYLGSFTQAGAAARGIFESAPLVSSLPYLEFAVAGDLGQTGLSLELVELDSGKVVEVKPLHEPGSQWVDVDVKAPTGKFKLVARDDSSTGWFAFKEPREKGRLSFRAQSVIGMARYAFIAGFLSLAGAVVSYGISGTTDKNLTGRASVAA